MPPHWIVTFDVSTNADRRAVHQVLARHGVRSLHTAYDLIASLATIDDIVERLRPHVAEGDHLLAWPTCARCRSAAHGRPGESLPPHAWIAS